VVDLSGLAEPNKVDYLHRLRLAAEAHREQRGVPHWVIYDEAHLLGTHEKARWTRRGGYVLSSFAPALLPATEIDSSDVVLELTGTTPQKESLQAQCGGPPRGSAPGHLVGSPSQTAGPPTYGTATSTPTSPYPGATVLLPGTDGQPIAPAATMHDFRTAVEHLDPQALQYHLERGDSLAG